MKHINRNAFHERLLHRYILEGLYTGRPAVKRLLPEKFRTKPINAVIPESTAPGAVRPDFKIYFKGIEKPLWLEVKWTPKSSPNSKQIKLLKQCNGVIAHVAGDFSKYPTGITYSQICVEDVGVWLRFANSRLWKDALSECKVLSRPKHWLLVLRGGYKKNWKKMTHVAKSQSKGLFWAFQNQKRSFDGIFGIGKGDTLYLMDLRLGFSPQKVPRDISSVKGISTKLSMAEVTQPHGFEESSERGSIFEMSSSQPIEQRKWVHFIKFNVFDSGTGEHHMLNKMEAKMIGQLWPKICDSANIGGGSPWELTESEADILKGLIHRKIE